jgi:hypothetical protein
MHLRVGAGVGVKGALIRFNYNDYVAFTLSTISTTVCLCIVKLIEGREVISFVEMTVAA